MGIVKRKPPRRFTVEEKALLQLHDRMDKLEATATANWAQLNAWHNDPANDVQALAARVEELQLTVTHNGAELRERIAALAARAEMLAAHLGDWSRENKLDNFTVEYRLKHLVNSAEDWDGDGLTKTVIALREEIRDVKGRLGGWPPETAGAPDTFLRPTGNRRLIILNVRWPTGTSQGERIGPLAVRADDIYRIVPLTNPGRCEVEVQMPGLVGGDAGSIRNDTVGPVLFTFVVEGEFAEIVARINA